MTLYTYICLCMFKQYHLYIMKDMPGGELHMVKKEELGNEKTVANWTRMCMSPPGVRPANPLAAEPYGRCQHLSIHSPVLYPEHHLKLTHASTDKHQTCST